MLPKILTSMVRICALVSFAGLATGASANSHALQLLEVAMIGLWLHQDWKIIFDFYKK